MIVEVRKSNKRVYLMEERNGRVLSMSEQYATVWNAKRAARRMFPDYDRYIVAVNGTRSPDA